MDMIDPKMNYCECGYKWKFNRLDKLLMFLHIRNTVRCPHCGNLMEYKLIYHIVKVGTKPNKDRMEIWKKC